MASDINEFVIDSNFGDFAILHCTLQGSAGHAKATPSAATGMVAASHHA